MMARSGTTDRRRIGTDEVAVDLYRAFVFPNRMREQRRAHGFPKLLPLAARIPDIPYIRLSKIERGEVVPRPEELRRVAAALKIAPAELLVDIDAPGFDIARWAEPFADAAPDLAEERFAVLLAAAVRARRAGDPALTIAAIERDYGLPPVNLSRVENAHKTIGRWNAATRAAILALFDAADEAELRARVEAQHRAGTLNGLAAVIGNPAAREERTRERIADVAAALAQAGDAAEATPPRGAATAAGAAAVRLVAVTGAPLPDGLIADVPTGEQVEAPRCAGPRSFALKVCRATLGCGLPARSVIIVDPDRIPAPGGLAVMREESGWRLLSVGLDRDARLVGYSTTPALDIPLDEIAPSRLASVVTAIFP
jgi:transcriptional regulator with XRE-family HTH domain